MKWKGQWPLKHKLGGISGFIIGLFYVLVIIGLFGTIIYTEMRFFEFLIVSIIIYGVVYIVFLSHIAVKVFIFSSVIGTIFITFACWIETPFSKGILKEVEGVLSLWQRIAFNMPIDLDSMHFDETSMVVITLIASVVVLVLFNKLSSFYILTGVILSFFLFSWFMSAIESKLLFFIFCTLTVLSYLNKVYRQKLKLGLVSGDFSIGNMLLFTIPIVMIPVLIILFIPKSEHPIKWEWLDIKINNALLYFEQRFNYIELENFSLSSIGFSNDKTKRLGGAVNPGNIEVLKVKTKNRTYLRGAVYYWYEDSTWTRSNVLSSNVNDTEMNETRRGWSDVPVDEIFSYVSEDDRLFLNSLSSGELNELLFPSYSLEIEIRNMITNNIFLPLKSIMPVKSTDGDVIPVYELDGGIVLSENRLKRGDRYKLSFIQPMYGEALLKKALSFSGDLYNNTLKNLTAKQIQIENEYLGHDDFIVDEEKSNQIDELKQKIERVTTLLNESNEIYNNYTKLPDNIPLRISELAKELTKGLKNDYEKTVAIEKYLRENHSYTLSPENVPLDKDFVDYFLFEKKEGYCTYFATSMVVLLRTLGIPSRYVEGYVLPPEHTSDNVYTVTNNNAHAWVEVYFQGFGWLVFEPTTAYAGTMDYKTVSWSFPEEANMSYMDMMNQYRQIHDSSNYIPVDFTTETESESVSLIYIFLLVIGIIVFLCILINLVATIFYEVKLKMNKKEKTVLLRYNYMINWLSLTGYRINPGESARDFAVRIDNEYYLSYSFKEITEIFSKVRYGDQSLTYEEADKIRKIYIELKKKILKEIGIRRYLPLRRILLGL